MTGPLLALRATILATLEADEALAEAMGGTVRLHDEPPAGAVPVYALFGDGEARVIFDSVTYLLTQLIAPIAPRSAFHHFTGINS